MEDDSPHDVVHGIVNGIAQPSKIYRVVSVSQNDPLIVHYQTSAGRSTRLSYE